jgi:hypothetical protein
MNSKVKNFDIHFPLENLNQGDIVKWNDSDDEKGIILEKNANQFPEFGYVKIFWFDTKKTVTYWSNRY